MVTDSVLASPAPVPPAPFIEAGRTRALLELARQYDRRGHFAEAAGAYQAAIAALERLPTERPALAEALRRLAVVLQRRREMERARELCWRSHKVAVESGDSTLIGEALNTLGGLDMVEERLEAAAQTLHAALQIVQTDQSLRGRIEQNLGTVASMRGDTSTALAHYHNSLQAFLAAQDEHGSAIAYHNLGRVNADRGQWQDADQHFQQALRAAEYVGDLHLRGLCFLNHAEVLVAMERQEAARLLAERALNSFNELGARSEISDAYRVMAMVNRASGHPAASAQGLQLARELAAQLGSVVGEGEALRELARVYRTINRLPEALDTLVLASELHSRIGLRFDVSGVLEGHFPPLIRDWGETIAAIHPPTFASSREVSSDAAKVARSLGLSPADQATMRLGALFYDVGKLRAPLGTLDKSGPLTTRECEFVRTHTVLGEDLLGRVRFPWDIRPIIRSHHERLDGGGYPDGLRGEAIPVAAQIVGLLDVYRALLSPRPGRPAMTHADALRELEQWRPRWRADVYEAFRREFVA
jgi:putative nucleotidyltransferase with HDIG domain